MEESDHGGVALHGPSPGNHRDVYRAFEARSSTRRCSLSKRSASHGPQRDQKSGLQNAEARYRSRRTFELYPSAQLSYRLKEIFVAAGLPSPMVSHFFFSGNGYIVPII